MTSLTETDKVIAWNRAAKGRGNRWRMMRDIVASLAITPMTLMQTQRALMRLRGLTRRMVHGMMLELEDSGDIKQVSGTISGVNFMGWSSSDKGVHFWLGGSIKAIPAMIVRVLPTTPPVPQSEERQKVPGGPNA